MADKRISQLNSHTTPSGSDLLVIVNNNETKKITYADLTATITGSQTDLTSLNQFTQSFSSFSSSVHTEILAGTNEQDLSNLVTNVTLGILSGSVDSRLDNLEANTGSFATTGSNNFTGYQSALAFNADDLTANSTAYIRNLNGIAGTTISVSSNVEFFNGLTGSIGATNGVVSGSSQLTSSFDDRYILSGSITQTTWDNISGKPNGLVSQSDDDSTYATTGSNIFIGEEIISGSLILSSSVPATLAGVEGDKKGTITFDENYLYYCFADYTGSIGGGGATHLFDAQGGVGWNDYGGNYLSVGFSQEGEAVPPVAGWYFIDDNGDVKQLLSDPLWFSGGNPSPYPNGAGWMAVVDSSFVYNVSNPTITFYESNPGGVASDIWKKISLNTISGLISGSQQITDLGFATTGSNTFESNQWVKGYIVFGDNGQSSVDFADGGNTLVLSANQNVNINTSNGDIILNPDGNIYKGSANAGNGLVTDGYLGVIIGDESRINTGTGHSITDNLDNIINLIPTNYATTGSNTFIGTQTIQTPSPGIPNSVYNWVGQGGWNQGYYSNLTTTGGTGTGLTVDVAAGGAGYIDINAITINTPGSGYTNGDVITINNENNLPGDFTIGVQTGSSWIFDESGLLTTPGDVNVSGSIYADNLVGLVSSSAQITAYGFISESVSLSSLNAFTSSYFTDSGSFDGRIITQKNRIDAILSASTANADTFAEIVTLINSVDLTNDTAFASYYTSSNARISSLENATSSYETTGRGIVSSSAQISSYGFVSGSYETTGRGIISSSAQLPSGLISGSSQLPAGIVSGSSQISTWGYTTTSSFNSFTASYTTDSSSFDIRITAVSSGSVSVISDIVHNGEAFTIQKGTPLYVSGSQGANPIVYIADASNPNKMPVTYIAGANITTNNTGVGILLGDISGLDLTGYLPGQQVYVAEGGGWSINPPSGSSSIKQFLGIITKEGNGGKGLVLNPGPATLPNLQTGYIWVGNTNNQAATMMTASFVFTSSYNSDSASFDSRISSLVSAGVPAGTVSGSSQLTSSFDTRYTLSGSVQSVTLPNGLVSGSSQLTSSYDVRYAPSASYLTSLNGVYSSSIQTLGGSGVYSSSAQLPNGIVSGSAQITAFGFISQSTDLTSLNLFTASYTTDSSSFNNRIISLVNNTGSYETTGRGIISESVVTISGTAPSVNTGNLWYDNNVGNLYLKYDTNTWVDTSNGVIQTIINDGSLLSTASFNAWTASYTASVPAGTVSGSSQLTSSLDTRYELQGRGIISSSTQLTGSFETTGRGIISSSAQLTSLGYVTSGGNATFNSVTANQYIVSSSVYYVTQSYSSGSTIFGNTADDTHQFTGSVSISGSLTASLTNGYFWVGNSLNRTYEVPTSSFVSTTTFNALSQSAYTTDIQTSGSIATLQASLGATSTAFNFTNITNPTNFVLVSYLTSSYNGGVIDILGVNNSNGTATSTNYQFASYGANSGISQNGKQTSGAGAPNLAPTMVLSGSYWTIVVTLTGTYNIKGVARLF